jgi:3-keto-disaccharide hydrolase
MQPHQGFLGRWNMTGTGQDANRVYWLEVSEKAGQLSGMFLNRSSSPLQLASVKVDNGSLVFQLPAGQNNQPGAEFRAKLEGEKLMGTTTADGRTIHWVGVRPPKWPAADANAAHKYGTPVELIGPKVQTLDAFRPQSGDKIVNWSFEEGALTNAPPSSNLVSKSTFKDFRVQAEYKLAKDSNSGLYLRGRYELQILDDFGKPPDVHSHMAIYGWTAPSKNAGKPIGEWQTMEAVIVANRVTVTLNGQKVHDNAQIQAITGGALDADEAAPGPLLLQGDHAKVWVRRLTVTPIQ